MGHFSRLTKGGFIAQSTKIIDSVIWAQNRGGRYLLKGRGEIYNEQNGTLNQYYY